MASLTGCKFHEVPKLEPETWLSEIRALLKKKTRAMVNDDNNGTAQSGYLFPISAVLHREKSSGRFVEVFWCEFTCHNLAFCGSSWHPQPPNTLHFAQFPRLSYKLSHVQ